MDTGWSKMWGRLSSAPTVGNKILYPDQNKTVVSVAVRRLREEEEKEEPRVVAEVLEPKVFEPAPEVELVPKKQNVKRPRRRKTVK